MFLSLPMIYAAFNATIATLIVRVNGDVDKECQKFESNVPVPCNDDPGDDNSCERTEDYESEFEPTNFENLNYSSRLTNFCDRINGKCSESSAIVFEDPNGNLSAWISSAPYFDLNVTDIEHVALSLPDAMRTTPRLYVKYSCSDETKERIEEIVNKICLLSPNERKAISDEQSKRR